MSNSLAVIGLPHVRDALESFGFDVVSGDGFPETSRRIRDAATSSALPVLVEDHKQIGLEQLISRLPDTAPVVIVRGPEPIVAETRASISLTSSLGEYLGALGFQDLDPTLQDVHVQADGTIPQPLPTASAPQEQSADSPSAPGREPVTDWLTDDENPALSRPVPLPTPEPAVEASTLSDWLADSDDEPETSDVEPVTATSDDEEKFDGYHSPALDAGSRRAELTIPGRRRITVPAFAAEADAAPHLDLVDEDLLDDLPDDLETGEAMREVDADTALDDVTRSTVSRRARRSSAPAEVITCFSGKGGEGKSTLALSLAQAAAEIGGKSVCLVDANRAQGDLGLYLRVRSTDLPSIYDAVAIGDPASAILSPAQLNQARDGKGDQLAFSLVQAPRPVKGSDDIGQEIAAVTAEQYNDVLRIARERFDLVILDTQITEGVDTTGLIDRVVAPLLARGGYGVGICELTTPGVENLLVATESMRQRGADGARMMTLANKVPPSITDYGRLPHLLGRDSSWKGVIHADDRIYGDLIARRIPYAVPTLYGAVMDILLTVTGDAEFDLRDPATVRSGLPWWKRWMRR